MSMGAVMLCPLLRQLRSVAWNPLSRVWSARGQRSMKGVDANDIACNDGIPCLRDLIDEAARSDDPPRMLMATANLDKGAAGGATARPRSHKPSRSRNGGQESFMIPIASWANG